MRVIVKHYISPAHRETFSSLFAGSSLENPYMVELYGWDVGYLVHHHWLAVIWDTDRGGAWREASLWLKDRTAHPDEYVSKTMQRLALEVLVKQSQYYDKIFSWREHTAVQGVTPPDTHSFIQDPDEAPARLCTVCGLWPDHHHHGMGRCVCTDCMPDADSLPGY